MEYGALHLILPNTGNGRFPQRQFPRKRPRKILHLLQVLHLGLGYSEATGRHNWRHFTEANRLRVGQIGRQAFVNQFLHLLKTVGASDRLHRYLVQKIGHKRHVLSSIAAAIRPWENWTGTDPIAVTPIQWEPDRTCNREKMS